MILCELTNLLKISTCMCRAKVWRHFVGDFVIVIVHITVIVCVDSVASHRSDISGTHDSLPHHFYTMVCSREKFSEILKVGPKKSDIPM